MLYRGFKIKSNSNNELVDSSIYGLTIKSLALPMLAERRDTKEYVLHKDGSYNFIDGFNDKVLSFNIEIHKNIINYVDRRYLARNIAKYLYEADELVLNYEPDKVYKVKLITNVDVDMLTAYDNFTITFEAKPIQKRLWESGGSNLVWNNAFITWDNANFPWLGFETSFTGVTNGRNLGVTNNGTYKVFPIIKLSGWATSVTLTNSNGDSFVYNNLVNEVVYVDCDARLVYLESGSTKINKRSNFSGTYMALETGSNTIAVTGSNISLSIEFIFNESYL